MVLEYVLDVRKVGTAQAFTQVLMGNIAKSVEENSHRGTMFLNVGIVRLGSIHVKIAKEALVLENTNVISAKESLYLHVANMSNHLDIDIVSTIIQLL